MNIFIAEDNLQDYLHLRRMIEKWGQNRKVQIQIYFRDQLYYQIPQFLYFCEVAFIDIHLPQINGLEFSQYLRKYNENIEIVLQSRSHDFALEGYRIHVLDYLLKPLQAADVDRILDMLLTKKTDQCLIYQRQNMLKKIKFENILYIKVERHNCIIHCLDKNECIYSSLLKLKTMLDQRFLQCYRSYVVNLDYIRIIHKEEIILFDNTVIPLSKKYYSIVKNAFLKQT